MAGLRIAVPVLKASVKQTTNIAVFSNTVRITLDATQSLARGRAFAPTVVLNADELSDIFRDIPLGNLAVKTHDTPGDPAATTPSGGNTPVPMLQGWTRRWGMDVHNGHLQGNNTLGSLGFMGLTHEMARDADHPTLGLQPPLAGNFVEARRLSEGPLSGRMLRLGGPQSNDFDAISMDAVSPDEGNVDLRVRFRLWEPMLNQIQPWQRLLDVNGDEMSQGVFPGHFEDSSNQLMLIVSMQNGTKEAGNENEVFGYALRNNWAEGPFPTHWQVPPMAWELVRFHGIQEIIEGQSTTVLRTSTLRKTSKGYRGKFRLRSKVTRRSLRLDIRPDERNVVLGEGVVVNVVSGWGELYRPPVQILSDGTIAPAGQHPAGKGTIGWEEIPGATAPDSPGLHGQWVWGRLKKTLVGDRVRLQAKVWLEGYEEPAAWQADILDSSEEAIQGGYTGIGTATPIHGEGGTMGQGRQVGPADVDQVHVQIPDVPIGTSVSFHAQSMDVLARAMTPEFINTGTLVSTWWDEYALNQTPGDWFILRPQLGPAPDQNAVTNVDLQGKPKAPDSAANFLVREDPDLKPELYASDKSNRSLEHATRDLSDWIVWDPEDPVARMVNPDLPRDALAWNEPYPGAEWLGHDGQIDDAEVLLKFTADSWDQSVAVWLRASGAKGYETGYVLAPATYSQLPLTAEDERDPSSEIGEVDWVVHKFVNGERKALGSSAFKWKSGEWYWARVRIEGSSEREAARLSGNSQIGQPHDMYPYGGVRISFKFWLDGTDEAEANWASVIDDGFNPDPFNGFSGYRSGWDEWDEFRNRPYDRYRPVVPPIDRGFFAIGGPAIGNRQRYAEVHVLSPRIPRLDSAAYDGVHNLLDEQTATGAELAWTVENATEIGTVAHPEFEGGLALEIAGSAATANGATPRLISNERVPVEPGQAYVALATLDNFQHEWIPGSWQNSTWYVDRYRRVRVGLRWFDETGVQIGESMRPTFQGSREIGRPRYVGEGYFPPESGYYGVGPATSTQKSWYDLSRTDGPGDPYAGYAFPADQRQPFRFQEEWRFWIHGGARHGGPGGAGWALPQLHTAPEGAVSAAVVIELENTQTIETVEFEPVVRIDYIGAQNRIVPGRPVTGYRDERYRVGEIGVFPAFEEPAYESWNVAPGQFAMPPAQVDEHAHIQGFEVVVHGHFSLELDAPEPAVATMFKPSAKATKPQFARPQQDAHDGGWTKQDGSSEFIWSAIDDLVPDDGDYAQSEHMPEDDLYVAQLTQMTNPDPDSDEKYLVHVRYRRRGATPTTLRVALYQGELPIAEWEHETDRMFATTVHELTPAQVATITDYQDLRIRLVGDAVLV